MALAGRADMSIARYTPWRLHPTLDRWGIRDSETGVNVLADFLPDRSGAVAVRSQGEAEALISAGRRREWRDGRVVDMAA